MTKGIPRRTYSKVLKGEKNGERLSEREKNGLVKTKEQVSLDRQSCHERKNVNINVCSDRKERKEGGRERNGPCFFPPFHALCPPSESQPLVFGGSGARNMFGVLFVKREQVLVR